MTTSVAQSDPEQSIDTVQGRTRPFPVEDGDQLPESENIKGGVASTSQEDADGSEQTVYAFQHELTVVTWRNVASVDNRLKGAGSLILQAQNVLATDNEVQLLGLSSLARERQAGNLSRNFIRTSVIAAGGGSISRNGGVGFLYSTFCVVRSQSGVQDSRNFCQFVSAKPYLLKSLANCLESSAREQSPTIAKASFARSSKATQSAELSWRDR